MSPEVGPRQDTSVIDLAGLAELVQVLRDEGYQVLGPTLRDGVIVIDTLTSAAQLPVGWTDLQDKGTYRTRARDDGAVFGFAAPATTWKSFLFPARSVLFRSERGPDAVTVLPADALEPVPPRALLGVRGCDLQAIRVQDRVFLQTHSQDPIYASRRAGVLIVAVDCHDPASTCFCTSMQCGPGVGEGADIVLSELDPGDPERHRFLVAAGTARGIEIARRLGGRPATERDLAASRDALDEAASRMSRVVDTVGLPELLKAAPNHPHWQLVADFCLSCGSCTMACPTCFCSDVSDEPNVATGQDERVRQWGSCFELSHSYIHGGPVRVSRKSHYRQWMTHKFATWWDQFDMSGCVGCGRCITWCPVGIDITMIIESIQADSDPPVIAREV